MYYSATQIDKAKGLIFVRKKKDIFALLEAKRKVFLMKVQYTLMRRCNLFKPVGVNLHAGGNTLRGETSESISFEGIGFETVKAK